MRATNQKAKQIIIKLLLSSPLSATDNVLLKYCSSRVHELSFILLEIPHEPWQFTLMAVEKGEKKKSQSTVWKHMVLYMFTGILTAELLRNFATDGYFHYPFIYSKLFPVVKCWTLSYKWENPPLLLSLEHVTKTLLTIMFLSEI